MAIRWGGLRIEPYDPDAVDADADGIVQEGTAWERPGATRLVDEFGQDIQRGLTSVTRPRSMRVIDREGKEVNYKPTYADQAGAPAGKPTPLREQGYPSLQERGLPTVQEITAPPAAQTAPTPAPTPSLPSPSEVAASQPRTPAYESGRSAVLSEKSADVMQRLKDAGASVFELSDEYVEANRKRGARTPEETYERQRNATARWLSSIRTYLQGGEAQAPELGKFLDTDHIDRLHPDVKKMILEMSDDELMDVIQEQAVKLHGGISRSVRVSMPRGERFDSFIADGRYKTTHEVQSDHSGSDVRTEYEVRMGIPSDAPADLRPVSAYVTHPEWEQRQREIHEEQTGSPPGEFSTVQRDAFGNIAAYGAVEIVLRPEVSDRVGYGAGDSARTFLRPVQMDNDSPEEIFSAIMSGDHLEGPMLGHLSLSLLESKRSGSFANVNSKKGGAVDHNDRPPNRQYFEALVMGGFGLEDIDEIRVDYDDLAISEIRTQQEKVKNAAEQTKKIREEFLSPEALAAAGLTPEEIAFVTGVLDNYRMGGDTAIQIPKQYMLILDSHQQTGDQKGRPAILDFRRAKARKETVDAAGVKMKVTSARGIDLFSPESYGGQPGDDIESVLKQRAMTQIAQTVRDAYQRATRPAEPEEEPAFG